TTAGERQREPRLPDAWLTGDEQQLTSSVFCTLPHLLHLCELDVPPDELTSGGCQERRQGDARLSAVEFIAGRFLNRWDEPIAALRYRLNVVLAIGRRPENAPQRRDGAGQASLLHRNLGPDLVQQMMLLEQTAGVVNQHGQEIEHLRRKRDDLAPKQQLPLRLIEPIPIAPEQTLSSHPNSCRNSSDCGHD